ncbi:hypothetical protein GOHSU_04_01110 [Gordonia hirsuta DSM 44140 = NBRC 16056]|uniref:Uncharacterized protein n=1 Tax=Gordonia hirsuta DSM 44140 = NBRC 16056 TaxID=1121927 RepID=L7L863_9ACTN|nr:hypothetical protein [Gordonia hirsuta]GAC56242.1 hypothetical protein GOHSU_04_01110 [Gordonia hirsuta DSM 44140 = NBRC 16056]
MVARSRFAARTGLVALALALAAATTAPAPVHAEPTTPDLGALTSLLGGAGGDGFSLSSIPGDAELAEALRTLKAVGAEQKIVEVLQAIMGAEGSPDLGTLVPGGDAPGTTPTVPGTPDPADPDQTTDPEASDPPASSSPAPEDPDASTPAAAPVRRTVDAPVTTATDGLAVFEKLTGAKVLTPAFAPFCAATTADNPLGLVSAPAAALPGPFPKAGNTTVKEALTQALQALNIGVLADILAENQDIDELTAALTAEQTAFALVPPPAHTNENFQVAWFNTGTLQGGMAELKPLAEVTDSQLLSALAGQAPLRLARVDTGQGSILTAVFGTTSNAGRTCYFLPAVGIVDTPSA